MSWILADGYSSMLDIVFSILWKRANFFDTLILSNSEVIWTLWSFRWDFLKPRSFHSFFHYHSRIAVISLYVKIHFLYVTNYNILVYFEISSDFPARRFTIVYFRFEFVREPCQMSVNHGEIRLPVKNSLHFNKL